MKKLNRDLLEIPEAKRTLIIQEDDSHLPYMIFYQSKGGWPGFQLFKTLEEAEKVLDRMKELKLKPVLYLDLTNATIIGKEK